MAFINVNNHGHAYKIYLNHCLLSQTFQYGDGAKFLGVVLGQTLVHTVRKSVI
jgi:hypothetical protein